MKLPIISSLITLTTAHFTLNYPTSRGGDESTMSTFPCGGLSQSIDRTNVSLTSGTIPIALKMGHSHTAVEVLLSLGNDPGTNFNITLVPTFGLMGLGDFCLPNVTFDRSVLGTNVNDGMNATLQVQSNGDPSGGLYACADIRFSTSTHREPSSCSNNTGISASPFTGDAANRNANESTAEGQAQGSSAKTSTGGAPLQTAALGLLGAAVVGGIAVL